MQKELTIRLDAALLARVEHYARVRDVPLSSLIETSLQETLPPETSSFAARWRGKFRPANRNDVRYKALGRKYL